MWAFRDAAAAAATAAALCLRDDGEEGAEKGEGEEPGAEETKAATSSAPVPIIASLLAPCSTMSNAECTTCCCRERPRKADRAAAERSKRSRGMDLPATAAVRRGK